AQHQQVKIQSLDSEEFLSEEHQNEQWKSKRKSLKTLAECTRPTEPHLEQEMVSNFELQKECNMSKNLLERAMKKMRVYERQERECQLIFQDEIEGMCSRKGSEVSRLRTKVFELSHCLEVEQKNSRHLEKSNEGLHQDLTLLRGNLEKLRKRKRQLEEEVVFLRCQLNAKMMDHRQREQYKRESEQRAGQELQQKLQEVNLFLHTQAAAHDRIAQVRAATQASIVDRLQQRIRDLEQELSLTK
ncbi:ANR26 protein, partial [Nothoprocta ornata]|nr:ANR26 protein [Nothoprocta ornata]